MISHELGLLEPFARCPAIDSTVTPLTPTLSGGPYGARSDKAIHLPGFTVSRRRLIA
jgi:hypothetical protein